MWPKAQLQGCESAAVTQYRKMLWGTSREKPSGTRCRPGWEWESMTTSVLHSCPSERELNEEAAMHHSGDACCEAIKFLSMFLFFGGVGEARPRRSGSRGYTRLRSLEGPTIHKALPWVHRQEPFSSGSSAVHKLHRKLKTAAFMHDVTCAGPHDVTHPSMLGLWAMQPP